MTILRIAVAVLGLAAFAAGPALAGGGCSSGAHSSKSAETSKPVPSADS